MFMGFINHKYNWSPPTLNILMQLAWKPLLESRSLQLWRRFTSSICWLVVDLWKIWVRQLWWWNSQLNGKITNVPNHQQDIVTIVISLLSLLSYHYCHYHYLPISLMIALYKYSYKYRSINRSTSLFHIIHHIALLNINIIKYLNVFPKLLDLSSSLLTSGYP